MSNNMIVTKSQIETPNIYHTYYDLEIINNDTTLSLPVPLRFSEIRNMPYLNNPSDYYCSVIRFNVETGSGLPVIIPNVQINQLNVNLTIYSFTLKYKTYESQEYLIYVPSDLTKSFPNPPIQFQDIENQYYFCYSTQAFMQMVNNTLTTAFNSLNSLVVAGSDTLPTTNPPWFDFDPIQQLPTLNSDILGYDNSLENPIEIYMNLPCYTLFNSFNVINYGYNVTNGKNVKFVISNNNGTNIFQLSNYNALQSYCEISPVPVWNPVSNIVFTSQLLPVAPSLTAVPKVYNGPSNLFNVGNNSNFEPIITDFLIPITSVNRYQPSITYSPSGEYRLIDLYGNQPLSAINLQVYFKDKFGGLHPIYLNSGCSASIKIMFRRKDYGNINISSKTLF
jgi:hypothetical protein